MSQRLLVTSALPYANGSIHLGHLVEYIQTDVYVRYRRSLGDDVTYVCAADSHGTPIEVNSARAAVSPKEFVERYRKEQHQDFQRFGVDFSTYYTTDSDENRKWAWRVWDALKSKGLIYKKSVEQLYCEKDARFLPDRFVKGTCPKCGTPEQYGDVCEKCGTTYDPRELRELDLFPSGMSGRGARRWTSHLTLTRSAGGPFRLAEGARDEDKAWLADRLNERLRAHRDGAA